jgi:DNA-binding response OmpR family regulator
MPFSSAELSRVRHDLRSPIGQIVGFAEMLIEEAQAAAAGEFVQALLFIQRVANEALRQVNECLSARPAEAALQGTVELSRRLIEAADSIRQTGQHLLKISERAPSTTFPEDLQRICLAASELGHLAEGSLTPLAERGSAPELEPATPRMEVVPSDRLRATDPSTGEVPVKGKILIVDDSAANREILRRRLAPLGYELSLASDGQAALEQIARSPVDLLLLDIVMPGLDGFEILKRLKANPATQNVPVLMLSAIDEMDAVVKCVELGADDYLPKPFPTPLLKARVKACLANKRLSDQLRKYTEWLFGPVLFNQAVAAPHSLSLHLQERAVLFADIRGFTRWSEKHAPEEVVSMLNGYFELAERTLVSSDVIKTEYTGDEIMAVFANPQDAIASSVRLQQELGRFLKRLGLGLGIGVHSGPVIEGLMGSAEVKAYGFVGDTINTARRICDHAHSGEILVSSNISTTAVSPAQKVQDRVFKAKGKKELIEASAIAWASR